MKLQVSLLLAVVMILPTGCTFLKKKQAASPPTFDGKILSAEKLKDGGKIYIVPFSAGVGVEANEALDETALMLIKGVYEEMSAGNSGLTVLTSGPGSSADFILRGHFVNWKEGRAGISRMLLPGKNNALSVEGDLVDIKTGNVIVHFSDIRKAETRDQDHRALGLAIGRDIGRFLLSAVP